MADDISYILSPIGVPVRERERYSPVALSFAVFVFSLENQDAVVSIVKF